jgi:uncharacterized LabA/DUF88 family protein
VVTNVYVDGFNFYYGCIKGTRFHWLDFDALARTLLRGHQVGTVRYFTARVDDRPDDPNQAQRQATYIRALDSFESVSIHFGQFRTNTKSVRLARPRPDGRLYDWAVITEEKGTDVSLASHLLWDTFHKSIDAALVLSNDSDLQEPIDMAMQLGVSVILVNPHHHTGQAHHLHGSDRRNLRRSHLERCQLPSELVDAKGHIVRRPATWG